MKHKLSVLILILLFVAAGCVDDALFNGGRDSTITIPLEDFTVIEAESSFEIELIPDTVNKVLVTCGENLQKYTGFFVKDAVLYLQHNIKNSWSRPYSRVKLQLHCKPFERMNVRKPVKVFNTKVYKGPVFTLVDFGKYCETDLNLEVNYCLIAMSSDNFGRFKVKGKASDAHIWGWGSCIVQADSLVSNQCSVLHRGMGNVYVHATKTLDVSVQFSGNVFYRGNPENVNILDKSGSGNVFRL